MSKQIQNVQNSQSVEKSETEELKTKSAHLMHTYHRLQTKLQKAKSQMWDLELSEMEMRVQERYNVQGVQRLLPERVIEEDVRALRTCMAVDSLMYKLETILNSVCGEDVLKKETDDEEEEPKKEVNDEAEWSRQVFSCQVCLFLCR